MWPMLLNMTRDECRLTLRRLELEAYSNMINVFRAQGALEDNRKKLLEELRAVLHISQDRHSAEARRASNDQLLATVAEHLSGPNTGIAWICEGRRRVPLLPRGIPQTAYTEIADKAAEAAAAENKEIQQRLAAEKLNASMINEQEMQDAEGYNQESTLSGSETTEDAFYPIAMEDQTVKLWDTELITRKRKSEGGGPVDPMAMPPTKNMRNIPANTHQKHLNLSQLYSRFTQSATSKSSGHSKHSYNQVSKVSTSKSSERAPRATPAKPRKPKTPKTPKLTKAQLKKAQEKIVLSPGKYNASVPLEYAGPPNSFQASYAQAVLGAKSKPDFLDDMKPKGMASPGMVTDSPTMQLLTQPATLPHELEIPENAHPDDHAAIQAQAQSTPIPKQTISAKPDARHLIIKNKSREITSDKKPHKTDVIVQKPSDIKLMSNRQVVAPGSTPKMNTPGPHGRLVTTKVIGSIPQSRATNTPVISEKMVVVSKPTLENKQVQPSTKFIVTSSANTPIRERSFNTNPVQRISDAFTPKGIPATDLKVSAKAVVLNKSGQKMVVVPSKARTKPEGPLIHFKGMSTHMKLLPVSSQAHIAQGAKPAAVTVVSRPNTISSSTKVIGKDHSSMPIKTANLADIIPAKGMTPSTPKITNPILRPSSTKGNVIVVQKGTPIGKALAFAKNGSDMSKIIMGKNVTQLLQASKTDHTEVAKSSGNVIVLELNNEQSGRPTTLSEILDNRGGAAGARIPGEKKPTPITPETPVLFDNRMTDDTRDASSLDSTTESIGSAAPLDRAGIALVSKGESKSNFSKDSDNAKDSSSVTDWEIELDTAVERKDKDEEEDKLNSMHLDLGMSSDSDAEYSSASRDARRKRRRQRPTTGGERGEAYGGASAMSVATRTLLSQLQDEGSSSNDSTFALKAKISRLRESDSKLDRAECDELTKAKEKLSEKVREAKSQQKRIDIYSTAITPSDINLESFAYLEEGMLVGDDVFASEEIKRERRADTLHDQLSRLLGDDSADDDAQTPTQHMPLTK